MTQQLPKVFALNEQEMQVLLQTLGEIPAKLSFPAFQLIQQVSQFPLPDTIVTQLVEMAEANQAAPEATPQETPGSSESLFPEEEEDAKPVKMKRKRRSKKQIEADKSAAAAEEEAE